MYLFAHFDDADDHRAEDEVEQQLEHEIESDESHEHIRDDRTASVAHKCFYRVKKEEITADEKDSGIDYRAHGGSDDSGKEFALRLEEAVRESGAESGGDALDENYDYRPERTVFHKEGGVARKKHHDTENESEPASRHSAVKRGADDDGNENERHGKRPEFDETADKLKYDDHCRDKGNAHYYFGFFFVESFAHVFSSVRYNFLRIIL